MHKPTDWAGMIPSRPLKARQPETTTGTPSTASTSNAGGGFEGLAARTYQRRAADRAAFRERAEDEAFRLATERGPDGVGGPWGDR